jgi:polyisoprenoid-binding protein YceI
MKKLTATLLTFLVTYSATAQVWFTKTAAVSFFSSTQVEDISATNNEAISFLDAAKGAFRFQVLIKGFKFPKAAMQEHFNDTHYMSSDQFPKAEFKGNLVKPAAVNFNKDGIYKVEVAGELTMHGITQSVTVPGTITIKAGVPSVEARFKVNRTKFGITVPKFTAAKIAEDIEVTVAATYQPYKS